jgi:hypothetical protein
VEENAKIVGIGVPISVGLGVAHYIEDTCDDFPLAVHAPPFKVTYIDAAGTTVTRDVIRYDPVRSMTRIDHPQGAWILKMFTKHFRERGILRWFTVGRAQAWVMNTQPLYDELKRLAEKSITMYLTRDEWVAMNQGSEDISTW